MLETCCGDVRHVAAEESAERVAHTYLVPAVVVPDEREIVGDLEGAVLVEQRELTRAPRTARHPQHHRVVRLVPPRLKEKIKHPRIQQHPSH